MDEKLKAAKNAAQLKMLLAAIAQNEENLTGIYHSIQNGKIVRVNANGKKVNSIQLALMYGVNADMMAMLLEDEEKRLQEWYEKQAKEPSEDTKKESTETVD